MSRKRLDHVSEVLRHEIETGRTTERYRQKDLHHLQEKLNKETLRANLMAAKAEKSRINALFAAGKADVALANVRTEGIATALATKVEDTRIAAQTSTEGTVAAFNARVKPLEDARYEAAGGNAKSADQAKKLWAILGLIGGFVTLVAYHLVTTGHP